MMNCIIYLFIYNILYLYCIYFLGVCSHILHFTLFNMIYIEYIEYINIYGQVFSDEFETSGRLFEDGEDSRWTALDKNDCKFCCSSSCCCSLNSKKEQIRYYILFRKRVPCAQFVLYTVLNSLFPINFKTSNSFIFFIFITTTYTSTLLLP